MSNRCILPLAFLLVLLFVSLAESCSAQGQPQDEKQKDTAYQGKTVSQWIEVLKDKDVRVRNAAAFVLGQIGPAAKDAVPALSEALKDKEGYVRRAAVSALGRIGPAAKDAVPALMVALKHKNRRVRSYAANALGQIGPAAKAAGPALKAMSENDTNFHARTTAANALKQIEK